MTEKESNEAIDMAEVRQRFVHALSLFMGSFVVINIFNAAAKGMGGLGPITFPISITILVVVVGSYIWFLVALYRSAKALGLGSGAVLLAVVSIIPLFAFISAVWVLNRLKQESGSPEQRSDA